MDGTDPVTGPLSRLGEGDREAAQELFPIVYDELRRLAAAHLGREASGHTLQPTALVHEAFLKLVGQERAIYKDRAHFRAVASTAMRRVLVDHQRGRGAAKRGADRKVTLHDEPAAEDAAEVDLVRLDRAIEALRARSPRQAEVVVMRFFGAMSVEEVATVLDVSERTVKGDWRLARAWLTRELERAG